MGKNSKKRRAEKRKAKGQMGKEQPSGLSKSTDSADNKRVQNQAIPSKKNRTAAYFLISLAIALIQQGLPLIGITLNMLLGAIVLFIAFCIMTAVFWKWESSARLKKPLRVITIFVVAIIYFGLIGRQMINEYNIKTGSEIHGIIPEINYIAATAKEILEQLQVKTSPKEPQIPEKKTPTFSAQFQNSLYFSKYPSFLIYLYESKGNKRLTAVGLALTIDITNNSPVMQKIDAYTVEEKVGNHWIKLHSLPVYNNQQLYWVSNGNLAECIRLNAMEDAFDVKLFNHNFSPGESIRGTIYLEYPASPVQMRIIIETVRGEKIPIIIHSTLHKHSADRSLGGGLISVSPDKVNLSGIPFVRQTNGSE
jgi:hypothetical protein